MLMRARNMFMFPNISFKRFAGPLWNAWRFSSNTATKKTCLYEFHLEKKAKMVDFAGFQMPVQYADQGVSSSHLHTRRHVSVFDVSHMLQMTVRGKDRLQFMESITVADIQDLKDNQGTLTLYTNEQGGIIDDLIVTKTDSGYLYVVSNAGCIEKDLLHVQSKLEDFKRSGKDVSVEVLNNRALLAVQGPGTAKVLQPYVPFDLKLLTFMKSTVSSLYGIPDCRVTRCGYTGEDGVELSIPSEKASHIAECLLSSKEDEVKLAGLGARDSLRLEAGLCLYGNDITDNTTPIEAALTWTIGKRRRKEGGFPGDSIILQQLKNKAAVKRVGFISSGLSARPHTNIWDMNGNKIGEITSGCPSPCLNKNVSMGYLPSDIAKPGTKVVFEVRKKSIEAEIVKMPFVPTNYYIG